MPASSRRSIAMLLGLSLVWGSTWIANDTLRHQSGPLRLAMLRYLLAGLFVACVFCARLIYGWLRRGGHTGRLQTHSSCGLDLQQQFAGPDKQAVREYGWIGVNLLLGCTMFVVPDLLLVWSAGHVAAGWVPMIYAALPLGLLLMAGDLRTPAILGMGAMLVLLNGSLPITAGRLPWILPIAGAVGLQGWSLVYAQRHCAAASSLGGVMVQLVAAAFLLRAMINLWHEPSLADSLLRRPVAPLGALCMLAGPATAVAYPLYYRLLQGLEPAKVAISEWLQTLVAICESAVLFHLRPSWMMIGAASVLVGCAALLLCGDRDEVEPFFRPSS